MESMHSQPCPQNPPQTFLDKKPPLLPRQSTSDVLSFTHIIANRLSPGQNVWDFFSPAPDPDARLSESSNGQLLSPISPTFANSITPSSPQQHQQHQQQIQHATSAPATRSPSPSAQLPPLMLGGVAGRRQSTILGCETIQEKSILTTATMDRCISQPLTTAEYRPPPPPPPPQPSSPQPAATATGAVTGAETGIGVLSAAAATSQALSVIPDASPLTTPRLKKRRSFAQSLKSGMLSLTQMLSPTSASFNLNSNGSSTAVSSCLPSPTRIAGPPHYNILVLGSDSAPLASTLYKMSSLLPAASKIRHYQEISGFFVAYFRSNGSFSCSPKTSTEVSERGTGSAKKRGSTSSQGSGRTRATEPPVAALLERKLSGLFEDEVKPRRRSIQDSDNEDATPEEDQDQENRSHEERGDNESLKSFKMQSRSSEETLHQLKTSSMNCVTVGGSTAATNSKGSSPSPRSDDGSFSSASTTGGVLENEKEEVLVLEENGELKDTSDGTASIADTVETMTEDDITNAPPTEISETGLADGKDEDEEEKEETPAEVNPSANATLSVHAFSLDTTWPVPRILAQTFWFPFAHGIIYIVDATRKNDPRGIDHLLNARQFLASLIADPFFKRKDIPVVVFANKAGLDPETCYRVDEIAEILGCEDWDVVSAGSDDGDQTPTSGGGMMAMMMRKTKSEEESPASKHRTRPWCVKSTRSDGAGDGLRESVEWLKSPPDPYPIIPHRLLPATRRLSMSAASSSRQATQEIAEDMGNKMTENTRQVVNTVRQLSIVQKYITPAFQYVQQKYRQCPAVLRFSLLTFAALSAVPVACFTGFMAMVTIGCLIVAGIAFTIVEGGFAAFASLFLLPAMGVVLLLTCGLGAVGLIAYACYRTLLYVLAIFNPPAARETQRKVDQGVERAQQRAAH
ncbi:hypothetical protein EMPS_01056 [Entomortierella parvispora]|uniref:Uncharacterized protein n=1 Tax=Entomortierella parvispora TaxID=205924 RepID=A0A9P3LSK4_9FUNG|nr:hypothetical protein EMPS_01056 [Entomortierella parvispora]